MVNAFTKIQQRELQELVGHSLLERLEQLLPALNPNDVSTDNIYKKENLASIFDAFGASAALLKSSFRKKLLYYQSPELIDQLCHELGFEVSDLDFDGKVKKIVSLGWAKPDKCEKILSLLGLSLDHKPELETKHLGEELISPVSPPFKSLKDYQVSVFHDARARMEVPNSRFIIQMPTGSGKTRTAMEIISDFLNNQESERRNVLWLAHSGELCEQASSAFRDVWVHLGRQPVLMRRAWGSEKFVPPVTEQPIFLIGGFQKLHPIVSQAANAALETFLQSFGLIVVDEAHKAIAPTYHEVVKRFTGDGTMVVGLTATPGRSAEDDEENRKLANFFFQQMVGISASSEGVIKDLQKRRVLAKAKYEPLVTNIQYELTPKEQKHLETYYDLPPGFLKKLGVDDARNIEIVKKLQKEMHDGARIIFFACSVEQSRFISSILNYSGYRSAHVDGTVAYSRRQSIIDSFRSGQVRALCNYGVLSTGFDVPQIDVVFIARPTASVVLYSQMIGRGLRGPEIGGTEVCKIIDVKDNIVGYSNEDKVYNYFEEYWK